LLSRGMKWTVTVLCRQIICSGEGKSGIQWV